MPTTPGIDVSHHQGKVDWAQVAAAGYRFAVIRATMGVSGVDTRFAENFDGARAAGLLVSAYHLVRPEHGGSAQAGHFLNLVGGRTLDLPAVLDVELDGSNRSSANPQPPRSKDEIAACVREAADALEAHYDRPPIMYTARWFWNRAVAFSPDWVRYPLWVAHYGTATPAVPVPWTAWQFWQHSATGQVPGIKGDTDLNMFDGSYESLLRFARSSSDVSDLIMLPPLPARATVTAQVLNIRQGPDASFATLGKLREGQTVSIMNLDGREVWAKIAEGKWAAIAFRSDRLIDLVQDGSGTLRGVVVADRLNIRSGPNMSNADVGDLVRGDQVNIAALHGSHIWAEFAPGQWMALVAGGRSFATVG
jgi:GH25 family lysozyme M1 (1,4-beta-N-acetylmuramidase)